MSAVLALPASLTVFGAPPTRATVTVDLQSVGRRAARAVAALAACWALAVVAVFIPLAHFVLVPGLFVTGLWLATNRAREDWRLVGVRGVCPRCGLAQEFQPGGRLRGKRTVDCPNCRNRLVLELSPPAAGAGPGAAA